MTQATTCRFLLSAPGPVYRQLGAPVQAKLEVPLKTTSGTPTSIAAIAPTEEVVMRDYFQLIFSNEYPFYHTP